MKTVDRIIEHKIDTMSNEEPKEEIYQTIKILASIKVKRLKVHNG